jgi:hypothetical protein
MVDIYRVFHLITRQYTFFSVLHGTFSKIDHILGHKASLNKFKKIKMAPCIISDHNRIKLDLNDKGNPRKHSNTWRLNNTLLKNQWLIKVVREDIKKFLSPIKMKYNLPESVGDSKGHAKRKVYSYKCLP